MGETARRGNKTLHLTNAYHATSGGIRTVYRTLMAAANGLGREIRLIVPGARHAVERVGPHARIYFVKAPHAFAGDRRYRLIMPTRYLLPWVDGIRQIISEERPDIIEVCDKHSLFYVAGLIKKRWLGPVGRPTLVGMSAERFDDNVGTFISRGPAAGSFARWYMREIYAPMFDFHLANSAYTADELLSLLPPNQRHRVHVAPPSLGADAFDIPARSAGRSALLGLTGGGDRARLLVYVGRLSREKNLDLLLATLERLVATESHGSAVYHLLIAGDGPERERLTRARERFRGRVHLLGSLTGGAAVRRVLVSSDVFLHPNPSEPFGLAPLEAMACGLPVVLPNRGGVLTYADANTAWPVEPSGEGFAAAVRAIERDAQVTARKREAAAARAAEFHESQIVPRYFSLLDALHEERAGVATSPAVSPRELTRQPAVSS